MIPPFLRASGAVVTSTATTLVLPVPANSAGDLAVLYVKGAPTANTGFPILPSGWREVYRYVSTIHYELVAWLKVPPQGLPPQIGLLAGSGQDVAGGWWGYLDVFGNVGYPSSGWLDVPGVVGSYGTYTRSALSSGTFATIELYARVRLGTTGITQSFAGWGSTDSLLGLTSANRVIAFVNNTSGNPIGNAASTDVLPTPSGPVWIGARITRATASCTYYYSYVDSNEIASIYNLGVWTQLGAPTVGTQAGTTARVSNSGTIRLGTNNTAAAAFNGDLLAYAEYVPVGTLVTSINLSDPADVVTESGTANVVRPVSQDGSGSPIEEAAWSAPDYYSTAETAVIEARNVYGEDRMIYQAFQLEGFSSPVGTIDGPAEWVNHGDRTATVLNRTIKVVAMTTVRDTSIGVTNVTNSHNYFAVSYFALVIRGRTAVAAFPLSPQTPRMTLGCAESYNLFITDQSYTRRIEQVVWSRLRWERVLDDISKGSATIPDLYGGLSCLAQVGGLVPWQYGLLIERDDQAVWSGPVINVARRGTDLQVEAADTLIRYQKRLLKRDVTFEYVQADAGRILYDIFAEHAWLDSDAWTLEVPQVNTQVPITRALRPRELKMAWDLISELLDDAVDLYVMNGVVHVWEPGTGWCYQDGVRKVLDGPYNVNADLVYGTFTEDAWAERPDWSIDGPGQANYVAVPGVESGEFGYRRIEIVENVVSQARYGVLDYVDADRAELPEDVHPTIEEAALRNRARTVVALRAFAPAVVSGGQLARSAPIDVDHLRPGALWKLDVWDHGFGQLLTSGRLRRVEVDVTVEQAGISESITPTLTPPGWENDE